MFTRVNTFAHAITHILEEEPSEHSRCWNYCIQITLQKTVAESINFARIVKRFSMNAYIILTAFFPFPFIHFLLIFGKRQVMRHQDFYKNLVYTSYARTGEIYT